MALENIVKNTRNSLRKSSLRKNLIYALTVPMFFFASCQPEEDSMPEPSDNTEENEESDDRDEDESKTYVFSEEDAKKAISEYDYESGKINFSESQDSLKEGEYISSWPSESTPHGMLAKITDLSEDKNSAETEPASIAETGKTGNLEFSKTLSPEKAKTTYSKKGVKLKSSNEEGFDYKLNDVILYDADGNYETNDDQITVDGYLSFSYDLNGEIDIDHNSTYVSFSALTKKASSLEIKSDISKENIDEREVIRKLTLPSFVAGTVGGLPVTLKPKVNVHVGTEGNFSVDGKMRVKQRATAYGKVYYDGSIGTRKDLTNDFEFGSPDLSAEVDLKGYAGPRTTLLVYGIAGPHLEVHEYGRVKAKTEQEKLDWSLHGGLELLAGGNLSGISDDLPELNEKIINYEKQLADGTVDVGGGGDGKLVYSVRNENQDRYHLATMNSEGSNKKEFDAGIRNIEPEWFPDGENIVYTSHDGGEDYDIYKINEKETDKTSLVTGGENRHPTVSPEGDKIAYVKDSTIYVAGSDGSYPNDITSKKRKYKDLHWSHYNGGDNIYFTIPSDKAVGKDDQHHRDIYKIDIVSKDVERITDTKYTPERSPEVYKNNIVFSSIDIEGDGSWEIYKTNLDGDNRTKVTDLDGTQSWPTWNSDGTEIYFISNGDVWKKNLENSKIEQLTNEPDRKATSPNYIKK